MKLSKEYRHLLSEYVKAKSALEYQRYKDLMACGEEWLDEDGYPTHVALDVIKYFPYQEPNANLFEFIKGIWAMKHFGWNVVQVDGKTIYHLSTAGWSGNESIIAAMQENELLWDDVWVQSRRGGHYIFEVKDEE